MNVRAGIYLAPFPTGAELRLVPCGNGGWMVIHHCGSDLMNPVIGAFTNTSDMIEALTAAFQSGVQP
jgi:hypothetical protein